MILQNDQPFHLLPAHIGLRKYILYYHIVFPEKDMYQPAYTLLPNACATLSLAFDGRCVKAELWGASLTPVPLGAEPNDYRLLLLIKLSPYGLYQITGQNQAALADKRLSLADIDQALCKSLRQAFVRSASVRELAAACDTILYDRMRKTIVSDTLLFAASLISHSHGQIYVREVARQSGYSERHLNRLFHTQIGMTIKHYARLTRFTYVLQQLQTSPCFFAPVSQQAGYFDQAHFDKDFKAISGVSPQDYLKTMSDFYYDGPALASILASREE